jgi:hypothetical protein
VRLGNFTAAARFLNLTQPTVSQQIKEFKGRLGVRLIARLGKTVYATVAGKELEQREERRRPFSENTGIGPISRLDKYGLAKNPARPLSTDHCRSKIDTLLDSNFASQNSRLRPIGDVPDQNGLVSNRVTSGIEARTRLNQVAELAKPLGHEQEPQFVKGRDAENYLLARGE